MEWERGEGLRVSGKVKGISSPARSHHETGGIEKRKETLSLRAYTIPGPAFFFWYTLLGMLTPISQMRTLRFREMSDLLTAAQAVAG